MSAATITALVGILGALFLATRGLDARRIGHGRMLRMALIWLAIIVGLVVVINLVGTEGMT